MSSELYLKALEGFPEVNIGDDLSSVISNECARNNWVWEDGDILIIAQKIVSKAENRYVKLSDIHPSEKALNYVLQTGKDPRVIELILSESNKVLRTRKGLMVVEHKLGFICANAGIDQSNIKQKNENDISVLLLPKNPDQSANEIRKKIKDQTGKSIAVLIIDSHGRPWRRGVVGITIGLSGIQGVLDRRGHSDLYGYRLQVTEIGTCDELAAAASILMGQAAEGKPVVLVRGYPYSMGEGSISDVIRPENEDLFR
ncbi:MAG: coenzyme F420-0:L-glutamate ligase [Anaerolineaceae bacterium]|nr:coenzyme F420-0:L-glutamate ligase [Anaerolineaceae bacterium]